MYCTPIGGYTYVFKLGHGSNGAPVFTQAGRTHELSAGRIGVGIPTITTYKDQPGTGIMWLTVSNEISPAANSMLTTPGR